MVCETVDVWEVGETYTANGVEFIYSEYVQHSTNYYACVLIESKHSHVLSDNTYFISGDGTKTIRQAWHIQDIPPYFHIEVCDIEPPEPCPDCPEQYGNLILGGIIGAALVGGFLWTR